MRVLYYSLAFALPALAASSSDDTKHPRLPCTIRSQASGTFFDLSPLNIQLPEDGKKLAKDARNESWPARGNNYGSNFTLNFCGPVVEELDDAVGIAKSQLGRIGAYYEKDGKIYSIG